jgi:diguanylate cyclase (GGDEF)-like protein
VSPAAFPLSLSHSVVSHPTAAALPALPRILIVDDDPTTRVLLSDILGRDGYEVAVATSGEEALVQFAERAPNLVLLDVMMPGIDGFETCERMRRLDPLEDVPIVMLTGADDFAAIDRAFQARATDFLTKPFKWKLLLQRVRYALRTGGLYREVRQSRLRQAAALRIARLAFWEWHLDDDSVTWSDPILPLEGASMVAPPDTARFAQLVHPDDVERLGRAMANTRETGDPIELELRLRVEEGERLVRVLGEPGELGRDRRTVSGALQDITSQRKSEELASYLALHDDLTGLGNRRHFLAGLRELLSAARSEDKVVLVAWIDITRFQRHNDALGAPRGDLLLRRFGRRMQSFVASPHLVARVGGDEFAVALQSSDPALARLLLDALLRHLQEPYALDGDEAVLSVTAGLACSDVDAPDAEGLVNLAEDAQRVARAQGMSVGLARRGAESGRSASDALSLERALRSALQSSQFRLAVQPQMDLRTGHVVGVECLLRWQPEGGPEVPPSEFVPMLEESGLIVEVGEWALAEACRLQRAWAAEGWDLRVAVNLSPRQFVDPMLLERFTAILSEHAVPRGRIELELTESLAMQRPEHTVQVLTALREHGVLVAVDDFGVGHSSLSYLLRFPIDTIKLDRAFISGITTSRTTLAIVRAAVVMAQSLGITTIAEGVETLRQVDFLDALGVNELQGYLVGHAMPPAQLGAFLRDFRRPGFDAV